VGRSFSSGSPENTQNQLSQNSSGLTREVSWLKSSWLGEAGQENADFEMQLPAGPRRNCLMITSTVPPSNHPTVQPSVHPSASPLVGLGPSRPCRLAVSLGLGGNTKVSKFLRYKHVPDSLPKFLIAPGVFPVFPGLSVSVPLSKFTSC